MNKTLKYSLGLIFLAWAVFVCYSAYKTLKSDRLQPVPPPTMYPTDPGSNLLEPPTSDLPPVQETPGGNPQYTCPESGYIDCMPRVVDPNEPSPAQNYCDKNYIDWAQQNCPNFEGVAY